jgi:uroporphyrinogen-III synthase
VIVEGAVAKPSFLGLRVLALESRRATEMAALISNFDGLPIVAPALREVPLAANADALYFAEALLRGEFDVVVFLTGVGTRALLHAVGQAHSRDAIVAALARTKIVARGPKPLAVLRELQIPVWVAAPEPNTWRELLSALDAKAGELPRNARIAVQEYGVSNPELLDGLQSRGAVVTRVPVYRWALPEDVAPLERAVAAIARQEIDVILFTTSVQVEHLWKVAAHAGVADRLPNGLSHAVIASIGPTTSEELLRRGVSIDIEASHPKMGVLVTETAQRASAVLGVKRQPGQQGDRRAPQK